MNHNDIFYLSILGKQFLTFGMPVIGMDYFMLYRIGGNGVESGRL
jgi:hypothetical protein